MSMMELFHLQVLAQVQVLTNGVRALEGNAATVEQLDACMQATRLIKRMACLQAGADLAHAMEGCFAAARRGLIELQPEQLQLMRQGADLLDRIARLPHPAERDSNESGAPQPRQLGEQPSRERPDAPRASARAYTRPSRLASSAASARDDTWRLR